jgi:hypothetical protein
MTQATLPGASALAGSETHSTADASDSFPAAPTKALPAGGRRRSARPAARPVPKQSVRVDKLLSVLLRKGRTRAAGEQTVLGTARLVYFSLIGAGLLVVALAVMPPLF